MSGQTGLVGRFKQAYGGSCRRSGSYSSIWDLGQPQLILRAISTHSGRKQAMHSESWLVRYLVITLEDELLNIRLNIMLNAPTLIELPIGPRVLNIDKM